MIFSSNELLAVIHYTPQVTHTLVIDLQNLVYEAWLLSKLIKLWQLMKSHSNLQLNQKQNNKRHGAQFVELIANPQNNKSHGQ